MAEHSGREVRPGDLVRVRRRRWRVLDVRAHDECQVLTLAGLGARDAGAERRVIAPFDTIEPLHRSSRLRLVTPRRWRRACRALLAGNTPPGALQSARHARIDLLPHQLAPALAVLRGLGSRVLLADDVGLGKTIQAGLVLSELRARAVVDRALIVAPAGLREQWRGELAGRFGIDAVLVDARAMRQRIATLPVGVNPWSTIDVAVASIDYVKRPETLPSVGACRWDVVIVDEAHGVGRDSDRHDAVSALAARAAFVVLLTATPHNGDRQAFESLCRIGSHGDPLLLFRRTRADVRLGLGRRIHRVRVRPSEAERRMHALVARFSRIVLDQARGAHGGDARNARPAWLALTVLNKRALSSARSLEQTIERRLAALAVDTADGPQQPALPLFDPEGEQEEADRPPELSGLALGDLKREEALLRELAAAARRAAHNETKIAALVRFLNRVGEPAVVFTEYRDTLTHLQHAMIRPAAVLHGGLDREERAAALDDFVSGRRPILLTTDAAGEGLNLHHSCRIVVNLELPWNPMRLEQRIGRVDRIGQRRTVHALHLIARDTGEVRILERLRERIAMANADIGAANPLGGGEIDDERVIARLVIDGSVEERVRLPVSAEHGPPRGGHYDGQPIALDFADDAAREAARLAEARRYMRPADEDALATIDASGGWLTFARASSTRRQLGLRMLLIVRAAFEDASGRLVESMLVPIALECKGREARVDRSRVDDVVGAVMRAIAARADEAASRWSDATASIARAFSATRLVRERAIAELGTESFAAAFQPGLFDRRADRQRLAAQAAAADAASEASRRVLLIERHACLSVRPQLLLVLAP